MISDDDCRIAHTDSGRRVVDEVEIRARARWGMPHHVQHAPNGVTVKVLNATKCARAGGSTPRLHMDRKMPAFNRRQ
eukprot:1756770-Alexandrium_andersonii.AAC.1